MGCDEQKVMCTDGSTQYLVRRLWRLLQSNGQSHEFVAGIILYSLVNHCLRNKAEAYVVQVTLAQIVPNPFIYFIRLPPVFSQPPPSWNRSHAAKSLKSCKIIVHASYST